MIRIILAMIVLYLLFLAGYLLWERSIRRKRNAAKKKSSSPSCASPKEDIIGKSTFRLRHSQPQATGLITNEKEDEKPPIFASENAQEEASNIPAVIPVSELDRVFSSAAADADDNEIIIAEDAQPSPEDNFDSEAEEGDETDREEADVAAGAGAATGVGFDDLSGMLRTVDDTAAATSEEKEEAGRTLVEIRKTDLFEQVVCDAKKQITVSRLMDDYFAAYRRNHPEAHPEPAVQAPENFDIRAFA